MFYAYAHLRPDLTPFYVGKGTFKRAHCLNPDRRNKWHSSIVAKHGREEIIIEVMPCASEVEAFLREQLAIKALKSRGVELVNLTDGGDGITGWTHSPEVRAKISSSLKGKAHSAEHIAKVAASRIRSGAGKGRPAWNKGIPLPEAQRLALIGLKHSAAAIAKMSAAKKGKKPPNFGIRYSAETIERMKAGHKNITAETRKKLSDSHKGKPWTEAQRRARLKVR